MVNEKLSDKLFNDSIKMLSGDRTLKNVRTRSFAGPADLQTLLIWNVLIAGVVHFAAGVVKDEFLLRIRKNLDKSEKLKNEPDSPAPETVDDLVERLKLDLDFMAEKIITKLKLNKQILADNIASAREEIKKIFIRSGMVGDMAEVISEKMMILIVSRLEKESGVTTKLNFDN
jgi:hypothetical protein